MNSPNRAVIDIGSNAIRFVAYGGPPRAPIPIYNEKLPVSFGKSVIRHGLIDDESMDQAMAGLIRFVQLALYMEVARPRIVATAAVRDATNGFEFVDRAAKRGINVEIISGEQEALAAGMGVLCDTPKADGYVCDLGGGSLELVRVAGGELGARVSLPLGTMRILGQNDLAKTLRSSLKDHPDFPIESGLDLYLVGGAWRAMARIDQHLQKSPLTIVSNHEFAANRLSDLAQAASDVDSINSLRIIPAQRADTLADAVELARGLAGLFAPARMVASACGIREGLLYDALTHAEAWNDPLLACTLWEGKRLSRFGFNGDFLADWMTPLFADEDEDDERLRRAACHLADIAWNIHPDYRALHAMNLGLHGNWLGIDARGRFQLARALFSAHGGKEAQWPHAAGQLPERHHAAAVKWGLAIRLAMRIDAGTGAALSASPIAVENQRCTLRLSDSLDPDAVERRLRALSTALGLKGQINLF